MSGLRVVFDLTKSLSLFPGKRNTTLSAADIGKSLGPVGSDCGGESAIFEKRILDIAVDAETVSTITCLGYQRYSERSVHCSPRGAPPIFQACLRHKDRHQAARIASPLDRKVEFSDFVTV